MNFFKRATTSIVRRPGKTVILLLLVFILGSVIAGAISVTGAINNTDANLRARMQPIVAVGFDHDAFHRETEDAIDWDTFDPDVDVSPWETRERMTPAHVRSLGQLEYISDYDFMIMSQLSSFDLERAQMENSFMHSEEGTPTFFTLRGTSSESMVQFESGAMNLTQGRQFETSELVGSGGASAVLVSEEFATTNNLSLGSSITFSQYIMYPAESDWGGIEIFPWSPAQFADDAIYGSADLVLTVVGIFEIPVDPDADDNDEWQRFDQLNTVFVPNVAIEDHMVRTSSMVRDAFDSSEHDMPTYMERQLQSGLEDTEILSFFIIGDPSNIEAFRAAAEPLLPEFHTIEDMSNTFSDIESSMATMQTIANLILYVSVGATLLILSLLITLFLRDRRYEMGVYLALGEKKGSIISQILLEVVATSLVGITLAVFTGHLISNTMSNNMLMNELQATQDESQFEGGRWEWSVFDQIGLPSQDMSIDEMADAFQVRLGLDTIAIFYGVGLGAVVLSTLVPVIYVVTLKPKKVLM